MAPVPHRVVAVTPRTPNVTSVSVTPVDGALPTPRPGQFHMVWAPGIGEAAISVSEIGDEIFEFTIRAVGATTQALCASEPTDVVGVRGPYGNGWQLPDHGELLIVAGGLGLAPLRPALMAAIERGHLDRVTLVVGARTPADLMFADEFDNLRASEVEVLVTVDSADERWPGEIGTVTKPVGRTVGDPNSTTALICGPEIMMRVVADRLVDLGVGQSRIQTSLERNMHCAIGQCGHCQLGSKFVCTDGPVFDFEVARPLLSVRGL